MPKSSLISSDVNSVLQKPKYQKQTIIGVPQPDKLIKFFDHNRNKPKYLQFPGTAESCMTHTSTYNPVTSWEGQSQCTETFGKLDCKTGVTNLRRPQGLAGTRVIETEDHPVGGIFNNGPDEQKARSLPLTKEQIDTEFSSPQLETQHLQKQDNDLSLIIEQPKFECLHLNNPKVQKEPIPEAYIRGGNQCDRELLTVAERKNINSWEIKCQNAKKMQKTAKLQRQRLKDLIKNRYPEGMIGVDSANNLNSEFYQDKRINDMNRLERHQWKRNERRKMHMYISQSEPRIGYNPLNHNDELLSSQERNKIDKVNFLQSKKYTGPKLDTFDRIFGKDEARDNPLRRQKLYDESTGGKIWTITQHHKYPYNYNPKYIKEAERVNKKLAHPSQNSLERGRNMQGFVKPGDVLSSAFLDPAF